jgi:hypothetical protein
MLPEIDIVSPSLRLNCCFFNQLRATEHAVIALLAKIIPLLKSPGRIPATP